MGEEPYYIDKISEFIEETILTEEERGFNQMILYGRDVAVEDIVSNAKRFPMMAERQVVIVKEAQDLSRTFDKLDEYEEKIEDLEKTVTDLRIKLANKRDK